MSGPDARPEEDAEGRQWRPPTSLSLRDARRARQMRRQNHPPHVIAARLKADVRDVELALSAMRGKRPEGTNHATLNVTLETAEAVRQYADFVGKPVWQAMEDIVNTARDGGLIGLP